MGVRKIEFGRDQGRLVFAEQPAIDSARLIALIQRQPKRYRLYGGDKLQFALPADDLDRRLDAVYELLAGIAPEPARQAR
jgi:transcription-repair coupling factor (superfamily II helicase)